MPVPTGQDDPSRGRDSRETDTRCWLLIAVGDCCLLLAVGRRGQGMRDRRRSGEECSGTKVLAGGMLGSRYRCTFLVRCLF